MFEEWEGRVLARRLCACVLVTIATPVLAFTTRLIFLPAPSHAPSSQGGLGFTEQHRPVSPSRLAPCSLCHVPGRPNVVLGSLSLDSTTTTATLLVSRFSLLSLYSLEHLCLLLRLF